MVTDLLSARFGLTDISKGVSADGTNYAVSGARITAANSLTPAFASAALAPSITQQMTNYLASTGGVANPNALYIISAGSNDVPGNTQAYLAQQAAIFTNSVAQLQAAGARYILIPNTNRNFLSTEIYNDLTAANVKFIPADNIAMMGEIQQAQLRILGAKLERQRDTVAGAVGKIAQQIDGQTDEFLSALGQSQMISGKRSTKWAGLRTIPRNSLF